MTEGCGIIIHCQDPNDGFRCGLRNYICKMILCPACKAKRDLKWMREANENKGKKS